MGRPWREVCKADLADGESAVMVRAARKRAAMSQEALAGLLDMKPSEVAEIESGQRTVDEALAKQLGQVFGVGFRVFLPPDEVARQKELAKQLLERDAAIFEALKKG
jgi:transcriptional regulator with XRE-family HTH domain